MQMLRAEGVGKRYRIGTKAVRELWALRDVSFSVDRGSILGVIGPNGAGKTTLLKVISRITTPTEGRVFGRGRVVPLLAIGAGFQADATARENIYMNAAMYGIGTRETDERMEAILDLAGVHEFIEFPLKRFSTGMYLRLAFSVAINMNPDILLADEVLAVGDLEFQEKCLERVQQAGREGMAVIFVSHDMTAITRLCDRVLWLNGGEIVKIGAAEAIVAEYQNAAWGLTGRRLKDSKSGSHKNEFAELMFVRLTSADGREVGALRTTEPALIQLGVRFFSGGVSVRPTLHVHARGAVVFRSRPPEDFVVDQGYHVFSVALPEHLLAPTVYTINLEVVTQAAGQWLALAAYNALSFQVFDPESQQRDHIGGLVAPKLAWQVSLKGDSVRHVGKAKRRDSGPS